MSYTVLDVETTGLSYYKDDITQMSFIRLDENFKVISYFNRYFYTDKDISTEVYNVTKVNKDMLKDLSKGIKLKDYNDDKFKSLIKDILENDIIVGHHIDFDVVMLISNLKRYCGISYNVNKVKSIDTMKRYVNLTKLPKKYEADFKFPNLAELKSYVCNLLSMNDEKFDARFRNMFKTTGNFHDSLYDAYTTMFCFTVLK